MKLRRREHPDAAARARPRRRPERHPTLGPPPRPRRNGQDPAAGATGSPPSAIDRCWPCTRPGCETDSCQLPTRGTDVQADLRVDDELLCGGNVVDNQPGVLADV